MKSIRPAIFETNSSSCHCMIICSKADWELFVAGKLFAQGATYKGAQPDPLIDINGVYELILKEIYKPYSCFWSDTKPTLELVNWIYSSFSMDMLAYDSDPTTSEMEFKDSTDGWWAEHAPDNLKEFISEHPDTLGDLLDWISFEHTPFSYEMIRVRSADFTGIFDDIPSVPPMEENDRTELCIWGFDYLSTPAMRCRAVWYS